MAVHKCEFCNAGAHHLMFIAGYHGGAQTNFWVCRDQEACARRQVEREEIRKRTEHENVNELLYGGSK